MLVTNQGKRHRGWAMGSGLAAVQHGGCPRSMPSYLCSVFLCFPHPAHSLSPSSPHSLLLPHFEDLVPLPLLCADHPPLHLLSQPALLYAFPTHPSEIHLRYHFCREPSLIHAISVLPQDPAFPYQSPCSAWLLALSHPNLQQSSSGKIGAPWPCRSWLLAQCLACSR